MTPPPIGSVEYCDERVCLSVCSIFTKFVVHVPVAMAQSSSGGIVILHVFLVLWMTSYLHIS